LWLAGGTLAAAASVTPAGLWRTTDDRTGEPRAIIRIRIEEGRLRGAIEHVYPRPGESPDPVCTRCSGTRRGQRVIGMVVLWGQRLARGRWSGGRVLDPEMGKDYPGEVWLEDPDTLKVRGYWGPFHRTQTWHRLKEEP
jgi:lathosterol oxidase